MVLWNRAIWKDITYTGQFQDCSGCTTGDDAGAFCRWFQEDAAAAALTSYLVGNGGTDERHFYQALAGIDDAFLNGADYFSCLADAYANLTFTVADGYDSSKAQFFPPLTTFVTRRT